MTTRRAVVAGLAAMACTPKAPVGVSSLARRPIQLGWRLVPGAELHYRCVTRRSVRAVTNQRAESWRYLVRELNQENVATLEARLTGIGFEAWVDEKPLPEELLELERAKQVRVGATAWLSLSMDGRIVDYHPRDLGNSLPHLLLGLALPERPVQVHDEWHDPVLLRPFSALIPTKLQASHEARARLLELSHDGEHASAAIETTGAVRSHEGGPRLVLSGQSTWDADLGLLRRRVIEARYQPTDDNPITSPGLLTAELDLQ